MTNASAFADLYLDVNLLLIVACLLSSLALLALRAVGLAHAVSTQLNILRWAFVAGVVCPIAVSVMARLVGGPHLGAVAPLNLTDFIVAQYLQGRIQMNPIAMESLLSTRETLLQSVLGATEVWSQILLLLASAGFAFFALRLVAATLRLRQIMSETFLWRRFGSIELRLSDTVAVPFTTRGLRRRYVVIPTAMLSREEDLRFAIGHEFQHLRQGDVEWEIVVELLRPLFFWNPAFLLWRRQIGTVRELSCDRRLMARRRLNVDAYCRCLLTVCDNHMRPRRVGVVGLPAVGLVQEQGGLLRRRMIALIEARAEPRAGVLSAMVALPLVALILCAALALQRSGDWSQDRLMLSTIINLERLAVINATTARFGLPAW